MQQASETRDSTVACFILPEETLYFSAPPHPHFLCLIQKSHFAEPPLPLIESEPLSSGEVASSGGTAAHSSSVWTGLSASLSYAICCRRLAARSRPTPYKPVDCSSPGSSVHGISQPRILEWVAISFSRGSSRLWDWTRVSYTGRRSLYHWATREATDLGHRLPQPSFPRTVSSPSRFQAVQTLRVETSDKNQGRCSRLH